ncbi:zinc-dependent alcohol dehydrogenase family protein [Nocardioides sp.]|uniref:zinc-dependent alcohol dehydrogenase family protein n=1 Tax=Nocardioides sp. TaxID=35761 RepID=UPI003D0BA381
MRPDHMRAWLTSGEGHARLRLTEVPVPTPGPGEVLLRVSACGVCRTDLHVADGDLSPRKAQVVPGHEIVGRVVALGDGARELQIGDRVGVAWLRSTCGSCRWCRRGAENLCTTSRYTGWDDDGGYADYTIAPAAYVYRAPDGIDDLHLAPLLCAGIIGYRALKRSALPPGGRLGIYGFGGSAHLTAQVAIAQGAEVHVFTRDAEARSLARSLGAASVTGATGDPVVPLDSAIVFAPAGELVPHALAALDQRGTLALAGIHMSEVPALDYQRHLFHEKTLTTVTSNTRADGEDFLHLAVRLGVEATVTPYPLDRARDALCDLADDRVRGAAVLLTD